MRVFEVFIYNLNQIRFKDNKDFFDGILNVLDIDYTDIAFCFESDFSGAICKKAIKLYPELKEYSQTLQPSSRYPSSPLEYRLSSLSKDECGRINLHIKSEHKEAFGMLLKKIPYSVNFGFMGVVLDNVNWDKNCQKEGILTNNDNPIVCNYLFIPYFSNSIRFDKAFNDGNKRNSVKIIIERFPNGNDLEEYPDSFIKFLALLGKPKVQYFECCFTEEENKHFQEVSKQITLKVRNNNSFAPNDICANDTFLLNETLLDSVTPVSGFSPKSIFNKAAKKVGYKFSSCTNGRYLYCKRNKYGHYFIIEIINEPFSSFFTVSCSAKGYNFTHTLFNVRAISLKNAELTAEFANKIFEHATNAGHIYSEELFKAYKETPGWYIV